MTTKQQIATGLLALMIMGSVALMPATAGGRGGYAARAAGSVKEAPAFSEKRTATELDQDQVRDLTYN